MTRSARWRVTVISAAAISVAPAALAAQSSAPASPATTVDRFLEEAREGTRRYLSQDAAIADGFKRVGVEFPSMGEHWISIARIAENTVVSARPALLIYVNIDGVAHLAGIGYTALVSGREQPPAFPTAADWHEHSGAVADESLPIGHHRMTTRVATSDGDATPRLFVMHAWVWSPNPDGVFATNNWSLPLARLGVSLPQSSSRDALRALALAADDNDYHLLVLRTAAALSPDEAGAAGAVLVRYHERAADESAGVRALGRLTPDASDRLAMIWRSFWSDLERALPTRARALRELRAEL